MNSFLSFCGYRLRLLLKITLILFFFSYCILLQNAFDTKINFSPRHQIQAMSGIGIINYMPMQTKKWNKTTHICYFPFRSFLLDSIPWLCKHLYPLILFLLMSLVFTFYCRFRIVMLFWMILNFFSTLYQIFVKEIFFFQIFNF